MKHIPVCVAAVALGYSITASAAPMSYQQLTVCAGYTQKMRAEAPALLAQDQANTQLRNYYNAGNGSQNDKIAFNQKMEKYRQDVVALNHVKQAFHEQCASREVRLRDVENLPEPARSAWRKGLDDIEVPYLGPSTVAPGAR